MSPRKRGRPAVGSDFPRYVRIDTGIVNTEFSLFRANADDEMPAETLRVKVQPMDGGGPHEIWRIRRTLPCGVVEQVIFVAVMRLFEAKHTRLSVKAEAHSRYVDLMDPQPWFTSADYALVRTTQREILRAAGIKRPSQEDYASLKRALENLHGIHYLYDGVENANENVTIAAPNQNLIGFCVAGDPSRDSSIALASKRLDLIIHVRLAWVIMGTNRVAGSDEVQRKQFTILDAEENIALRRTTRLLHMRLSAYVDHHGTPKSITLNKMVEWLYWQSRHHPQTAVLLKKRRRTIEKALQTIAELPTWKIEIAKDSVTISYRRAGNRPEPKLLSQAA